MRVIRTLTAGVLLCLLLPAAASAASPSLTLVGSDAEVGGNIHAVATLSGGEGPTEEIDFEAFAPGDPTCAGPAVFTDSVTVNGNGEYTSASTQALEVGSYHWSAEYTGDGENDPASSDCVAVSTVTKATPGLTSTATNGVAGGTIKDTATLAGGFSPTGALTFKAFGPADANCEGTPAFTKEVAVAGNGEYGSTDFAVTKAGTYLWTIAYGGDADNAAAASPCKAANETSTVGKATVAISTTATSGIVGGAIKDTATITGVGPTGTVTFNAFGPADPNCENAAAFTKAVTVAGNGEYGSTNFVTSTAGTYLWTVAYSGDANNNPATSLCKAANETSTVAQATPVLSSTATNGTAGGTIKDTATLASGVNPTGTLTFKAFGPADANCEGTPAFTKEVTVAGNAAYGSTDFAVTKAGTYLWTVAYSGDANNNPATSPCKAASETSTVGKATATISTVATSAQVGNPIKDTATITGVGPTGTVTFKAFGPADANCEGTPAFTKEITVAGNGPYGSTDFVPATAGTYLWTAEYSGDANNSAATSPCKAANETSNVTAVAPTLSSTATSATIGAAIKDTATLSGGVGPTGTLTFKAFGPNDATCAGTPAFTKEVTVNGNGPYGSTDFTPVTAGTYRWTIAYSGDASNGATTSACNAPNETSTVAQATPVLSSTATNGTAGGTIKDTATITGVGPTGTLTFKAFGPADANCEGAAAFNKEVAVAGNGAYGSTDFTVTKAGAYLWTIAYSGDTNNTAATSPCKAANETSTVGKATVTISTTATNGAVGTAIKDTATITGVGPTGTVTFKAFGPADANCEGTPAFTKAVAVNGNGPYGSTDFVTSAVGAYLWTAEYAGDANNNAATSPCKAANETSTVGKASPTLSSVAASSIYPAAISDTATIAAGFKPTGGLVFKAFGPDDATCAKPAAFEQTIPLAPGNSTYTATTPTKLPIGGYRWTVAYAGDANNNAAASPCNAADETSTVAKVPPQITVTTSGAAIGGAIASFATFGGGISHTGQIALRAYPPNDPTCSGAPAFATAAMTVTAGNGVYASGAFTPAQSGSYRWTATYSGDETNAAETTPCAAAVAVVAPATPTIAAHISAASISAGEGVRDTATIAAGFKPGGTITFSLFGPGDTTCGGSPALTSTVAVSGNGSYPSASLVPPKAGDYRFTATYSGDANNTSVVSPCGAGGEFVQVQKRTPTLKASAAVKGKKIVAKANLAAALSPQGKITFRIYGPGDNRCARKPVFSSQRAVHGTGNYSSAGYRFDKAGLYRFTVAYSGDERNKSLKKGCASKGQSIRVP